MDHGHGGMHSYAHHAHSEVHTILSVVDNGDEDDNNQHQTIEKPISKVEYLNKTERSLKLFNDECSIIKDPSQTFRGIILDIPSPPPKRIG